MNIKVALLAAYLLLISFVYSCEGSDKNTPSLTTSDPEQISNTSVVSGGNITSDGGSAITSRGVCWSTSEKPDINGNKTSDGSGSGVFVSTVFGLLPNTLYYLRAYATNVNGTTYGNQISFTTAPDGHGSGGQIIADHTIVDKFDDIPAYYINKVKEMWLAIPGESHAEAYREGLKLLEISKSDYAVNITESGTPESYTNKHLRASSVTWGDLDHASGWVYAYGEEDWYTSSTAIARTKAGITYCNTNNLLISAIGFIWCYDPDITVGDGITAYLNATQQYINHCKTSGYPTSVFFTTGPLDEWYSGAFGYNNFLRYEQIRTYVKSDPTRILFDYADILSWNDDGTSASQVWEGYTYPAITDRNYSPVTFGHISNAGAIRLAKATWWMLARIAGWNGE